MSWKNLIKRHLKQSAKPLIVILGPTASGKTSFSIKLAEYLKSDLRLESEVINADSRQLYKYLNIGTGKITPAGEKNIPHHLINVLDPKKEATAGWYQTEAKKIINQILKKNHIPIIVGGSMLYLSTITDNLTLAPGPDSNLRKKLITQYKKDNGQSLYKKLKQLDPEGALKVHPHNQPRLIRAVELCELMAAAPKGELRSSNHSSEYDLLIFGIKWPRENLYDRINKRTEKMFKDGWIDEIKGLIDKGYSPDDPGMKSVGYREIAKFLYKKKCHPETSNQCHPELRRRMDTDYDHLTTEIAKKSRHYARRQLSWWRKDERINWIKT